MAYKGTLNDKYYTPSSANPQNLTAKGYPDSKDGSGGRLISTGSMVGKNYGLDASRQYVGNGRPTNMNTIGSKSTGANVPKASTGTNTNAYGNLLSAYLNGGSGYGNYQANLDAAMNARANALKYNLNNSIDQLRNAYDNSSRRIRQDAEESLRQAYVNRMISQKNMRQQMSAMGLGGGATETSLASLFNNYGNARNNIETTKANNLSDLDTAMNSNVANLLNNYTTQLANLENDRMQYQMQMDNAAMNRQDAMMDRYYDLIGKMASSKNPGAYATALNNAIASLNGMGFTPTEATNLVNMVNTTQANSSPALTNTLQGLWDMYNGGDNTGTVELNYGNGGNNYPSLFNILAQLGSR